MLFELVDCSEYVLMARKLIGADALLGRSATSAVNA